MNLKSHLLKLGFIFLSFLVTGCSAVGYYTQSVVGHTHLMWQREPIEKVFLDADSSLKIKLKTAQAARNFASSHLSLPSNKSYTTFVQLDRNAVVWNVVATDPFSLNAKEWCYLVVGCASYRGYFKKEAAEKYASELEDEGLDVAILGAAAYSTLGWFADPLTSIMLQRGNASVAELIFHELAHQQFYIKGDSSFNEAFATMVGEQGTIIWLEQTQQYDLLERYQQQMRVKDDFLSLITRTKENLSQIYHSNKTDKQKIQEKFFVFDEMKKDYETLKKEKWDGVGWYDRWFEMPVNNARLAAIGTYRNRVPEFLTVFDACGRDFKMFYQSVEIISKATKRDLTLGCVAKRLAAGKN